MAIDFFISECHEQSAAKVFGICDDPPPSEVPAYLSEDGNNEANWIATVFNKDEKNVDFYAIDHCIEIQKTSDAQKEESRCDGLLVVNNYYKFVELKDCKLINKDWRKKGKQQLATTIAIFKNDNPTINSKNINAQICNKKHRAAIIYQESQDEFFDKTGIILKIDRQIIL
ncbi:MAG: hypothetical protein AB8E82_04440 [Aureispira sp.]